MKIQIPPDIILPDKTMVKFSDFLCNSILTDRQFGANLKALQAAAHIHHACQTNNQFIELSDDDYRLLSDIMAQPTNGYNPVIAIHLMPFFEAVIHAK